MVADKTDAKTRAIIAFFLDVEFVNGVNQQALYFMSSWSSNSAMSLPRPADQARQAQPEGYFMLQYSAEKVTDQLQKSITVTDFVGGRRVMICAGLPPTTVQAGTSLVTTAPDAMTALSPMVTPD